MYTKETLDIFNEKTDKADAILHKLRDIVTEGINLGLTIQPHIIKKIDRVSELIGDNKKLKVAIIGGFSEGKTSIVAAWLGRIDKASMKISLEESSDEVNIYDVDSDIELIDTPGLFGFKEKYNDSDNIIEKYKDITKKYVSEAHIVLYVMDSTNPIKASHKEDLQWLFRELGLLSRTVFILSRFDEVADVEDDWEYQETLKIKKENVLGRLKDMLGLTEEESADIEIVGVAANPFGKGMDYWLNNTEQLEKLSRIDTLRSATSKIIEQKGGFFPLVCETQKSVINDILKENLKVIEATSDELEMVLSSHRKNIDTLKKNLDRITSKGLLAQSSLIKFITRYFGNLKAQANGCGIDTFQSFWDAEIGKDGCVMYANIQNEFNTQLQNLQVALEHAALDYDANIKQFDSTMEILAKKGLDVLRNSGIINAKTILMARDGIKMLAEMFGKDLGELLKFKPWGATQMAGKISNTLQVVNIAMEIRDSYKKQQEEEKFRNAVKKLIENFDTLQEKLLEFIQGDDFLEKSLPGYVPLKEKLENGEMQIEEIESKKMGLVRWIEDCKKIATECGKL